MARNLKNISRLIDIANETKSVEESFLSDLKRSIELTAKLESRKPSRTYKPSSMNCIRSMYYQVMGADVADEPNYTNIGICNAGSDIHERIQTAVTNMKVNGMDCEYIDVADYVTQHNLEDIEIVGKQGMETKLYNKKYNMSFLCDGIIRYKGVYYILEIKTEASFKWQTRADVDPKHHNQGIAYSLNFGLDRVIFVYINRDILDMKAFMFEVDDKMRQGLIAKIEDCQGYVERQITPPKPDMGKYCCKYCGYKDICDKEG